MFRGYNGYRWGSSGLIWGLEHLGLCAAGQEVVKEAPKKKQKKEAVGFRGVLGGSLGELGGLGGDRGELGGVRGS